MGDASEVTTIWRYTNDSRPGWIISAYPDKNCAIKLVTISI